jgi:hypothetical protein
MKRRHDSDAYPTRTDESAIRRATLGAVAIGAAAMGAMSVGALAIGALAIRALAIKKGKIGHLTID